MGIECALAHDVSGEAYDLGKGLWCEEVPRTEEGVREWVWSDTESWDVDDGYREEIAGEIWHFIDTHPGCYLVHNGGGDYWDEQIEPWQRDAFDRVFRQVGSRYRKKS